jgi:UDP-N-acetylglucosamine--N-acetylmuramyl-(pentapeptide) pyrophosphoryl-undecaprenol N-acetylglucosamine transferase
VLVAGGGTGGHLYPGLAIARALVAADPRVRPHFIGAERGIERDVLPTTEFPHTLLDLHPLYRQAPWRNWRTVRGAVSGWRALAALTDGAPAVAAIGTGGYAAALALGFARGRRWPTIVHECDSQPGLTTRLFARGAALVTLGFPEAAGALATGAATAVEPLGNPISPPRVVGPAERAALRTALGFPETVHQVVLIVGGSQGALALNEAVASWATAGLPAGTGVLWATGRGHWARYAGLASPQLVARPYLDPIADAYAVADVAVTRAGAMTIAELCAWGIPAVLVPLPTAARDHQAANARALQAAGAAVLLPQADLDAASLAAAVGALLADGDARSRMATAARARGRPDAARRIAERILARLAGRIA